MNFPKFAGRGNKSRNAFQTFIFKVSTDQPDRIRPLVLLPCTRFSASPLFRGYLFARIS